MAGMRFGMKLHFRGEDADLGWRNLSQKPPVERCCSVNACKEAETAIRFEEAQDGFEEIFRAEYQGIARAIAAVNRDPGRAEELAVEVFLKWSRNHSPQKEKARGWLYRTAFRMALDDLRGQMRRHRYKDMLRGAGSRRPDEEFAQKEEQEKIRTVLAKIAKRESTMLLLRSRGFGYNELAAALGLKATSVGTILGRAQQTFRKEYERRYGKQ
jgi:RNA polymerase sigma factor (sigma-70 family)